MQSHLEDVGVELGELKESAVRAVPTWVELEYTVLGLQADVESLGVPVALKLVVLDRFVAIIWVEVEQELSLR